MATNEAFDFGRMLEARCKVNRVRYAAQRDDGLLRLDFDWGYGPRTTVHTELEAALKDMGAKHLLDHVWAQAYDQFVRACNEDDGLGSPYSQMERK